MNLVLEFQEIEEMQTSIFKKRYLDQESWQRLDYLYKDGVDKQRQRSKPREKPAENKPKINQSTRGGIKREGNICDFLYNDAQRRQNNNKEIVMSLVQAPEQSVSSIVGQKPTPRTKSRIRIRQMDKLYQLNQGILMLKFIIELNDGDPYINFETMMQILSKMNIKKYANLNENVPYAMNIWNRLKDSNNEFNVSFEKLKQLISNPYTIHFNQLKSEVPEKSKPSQSGLTKIKSLKQVNHFNKVPLTSKRVKKMNIVHNNRYNVHPNNDSSFASIGSKPVRVDSLVKNKHRQKSSARIDELMKEKQEFYVKVSEQKKEKEENELKECSFRPKTNPRKRPIEMPIQPGTKNEHLFKMSKQSNKPKVDRSTDDVVYEKYKHECTFMPTILTNAPRLAKSRLDKMNKSYTESMKSKNSQYSLDLQIKSYLKEYIDQGLKTPEKVISHFVPHLEEEFKRFLDRDIPQSQVSLR
jgi:hypothetical protein